MSKKRNIVDLTPQLKNKLIFAKLRQALTNDPNIPLESTSSIRSEIFKTMSKIDEMESRARTQNEERTNEFSKEMLRKLSEEA